MKPKDAANFALIMADRFCIQELAVGLNSSQALPALKLKMMILFFILPRKGRAFCPLMMTSDQRMPFSKKLWF